MQAARSFMSSIFQHLLTAKLPELWWFLTSDAKVDPKKWIKISSIFFQRGIMPEQSRPSWNHFSRVNSWKKAWQGGKKVEKGFSVHILLSFLLRRFIIKRSTVARIFPLFQIPLSSLFLSVDRLGHSSWLMAVLLLSLLSVSSKQFL